MTKTGISSFARRFAGTFAASAIILGTVGVTAAAAAATTIQMPAGLCTYQPINKKLVAQVKERADFPQVLEYLQGACPEVAELFVGPTGSIPAVKLLGGSKYIAPAAAPAPQPEPEPEETKSGNGNSSNTNGGSGSSSGAGSSTGEGSQGGKDK